MTWRIALDIVLLLIATLTGMWAQRTMTIRHQVINIQLPPGMPALPPNTPINIVFQAQPPK